MTMTNVTEDQTVDTEYDFEFALLELFMKVGAGAVDPRLIEPDHDEPDVEELIAFRTSAL